MYPGAHLPDSHQNFVSSKSIPPALQQLAALVILLNTLARLSQSYKSKESPAHLFKQVRIGDIGSGILPCTSFRSML